VSTTAGRRPTISGRRFVALAGLAAADVGYAHVARSADACLSEQQIAELAKCIRTD
jgi:hypothetical protein